MSPLDQPLGFRLRAGSVGLQTTTLAPSLPRNACHLAVSSDLPARHRPIAPSPSQTSTRGTAPARRSAATTGCRRVPATGSTAPAASSTCRASSDRQTRAFGVPALRPFRAMEGVMTSQHPVRRAPFSQSPRTATATGSRAKQPQGILATRAPTEPRSNLRLLPSTRVRPRLRPPGWALLRGCS